MTDNSLSRVEWLLGGLLILLLLIVMVLAGLFWFRSNQAPASQPQTAVVGRAPVYEGQTALSATGTAEAVALTWRKDAMLLKSSATWHQGANAEFIRVGKNAWSFVFYSPAQNEVAIISVVDGEAIVVSENQLDKALSPSNRYDWRIDSPEAIHRMLQEGGELFLTRERITTLDMALSTANPSGRLEWFITLHGGTGNAFSVLLDATSGETLEVVQLP